MNRKLTRITGCLFLYLFISMAVFAIGWLTDEARSQECDVFVAKQAAPSDGTSFTFTATREGSTSEIELLSGESFGSSSGFSQPTTVITEDVPPGWVLEDVVCDPVDGINITIVENGFEYECTSPNSVPQTTCTFFNARTQAAVPALSEWGIMAAAAGLMLTGVIFVLRRNKARAV